MENSGHALVTLPMGTHSLPHHEMGYGVGRTNSLVQQMTALHPTDFSPPVSTPSCCAELLSSGTRLEVLRRGSPVLSGGVGGLSALLGGELSRIAKRGWRSTYCLT